MWKGAVAMVIVGVVLVWLQCPKTVSRQDYLDHIKDKVVVLCGASSGIGEQLAYKLGEQGAQIMIVARTQSKLEKVKEGAIAAGAKRVEIFPYDFSNVEDSGSVIDKAVELFGGIDYLVLNHAAMVSGSVIKTPRYREHSYIKRIHNINTFSFFQLFIHALPHLEKAGGHIFVTSSMSGEMPLGFGSLYVSSKHAVNGFFYTIQQELLARKSSVGVTIGALGFIQTDDLTALLGEEDIKTFPEFARGDVKECAKGMMDSLITRPRTFTFPNAFNKLQRILWYVNPYYHEMINSQMPAEKTDRMMEDFLVRAKERGFQAGNI